MDDLLRDALFFLILINPMSKIVLVGMFYKDVGGREATALLAKSSVIGLALLVAFALAGRVILNDIFRIHIEALQLSGGFVLAYIGFTALTKGNFFQYDASKSLVDLAIVPLASPLIAGPATITAAIVSGTERGPLWVSGALAVAVACNFALVIVSVRALAGLNRFNVTGAFIRITGLFIMAIGVNMALQGITAYFHLPA